MRTSPEKYTTTAIVLHWLLALFFFAALPLGLYMHDLPFSPARLHLYSYHKWLGVSAFLLVVLRVLWRATHRPPALPQWTPAMQKIAGGVLHALLYVLMIAIPLSGWLMSSAKGVQTVWFGVLPLPDLLAKDKVLGDFLAAFHRLLNYTLIFLLLGHVGAALKHRFFDRDEIFSRMLPWSRR